jgi:hypothetical protein
MTAPPRAAQRGVLLLLAGLALAGCASLPLGNSAEKTDDAAKTPPARAQYRVEVDAPEPLRKLLDD